MKKILLLLIVLACLISVNHCFANDVNATDTEASIDDISSDDTLKISPNATVDTLKASRSSKNIDVSKTIKSKDLTKYYKGSKKYSAKFLNTKGKALSNAKVKIKINGKTYSLKTNSKGILKMKINLKPGNYKATAYNPKTGYSLTTNIKILSTIQSSDLTKVYKNNKKFRVKFLKSNGKALAKRNVKYKFNGTITTLKTNKNGVITVSLKNLTKGKYKIKLYHPNGIKKTNRINVVKSANTKLSSYNYKFIKSSSKIITVKLNDQYGYKVPKGYTVKAKIAGKTYKSKTDNRGIATFKLGSIKKGIYTIKFNFKSKGYYKSSKTSNQIIIYPSSKNAKFSIKSTKTFGYGAHTPFKLRLTSGDIPLMYKKIKFTVKGKTYTRTTDKNGMVFLPINLKVGKYTLKYSIDGDSLVNAKTVKTKITVKPRIITYLSWTGNTSFYQGPKTCSILLKDSSNKVLSGKTVSLTIRGNTYTATTSSGGIAKFDVITPPGVYDVTFSYGGNNDYKQAKGKVKINASYKVVNGNGYWLKMEQFGSVNFENLTSLSNDGVTDLFLNSDVISRFGKDYVESWICNASTLGIKVHLWVTVFKDTITNTWTSPIVNGKINTAFYTKKINEIKEFSQIKGISGIHLDYIRFSNHAYKTPGSTNAINQFVKQATNAIRMVNSQLVISCAVMAKMENGIRKYAQDFSFISQYMDVVMPMIYKGNNREVSSWITSTTKWYVHNSKGAKIWAGLQTYKSDSDITVLPMDEMINDANSALNGGADGLVLFRWGLTSYINFNEL